jgi:hypothetical protein
LTAQCLSACGPCAVLCDTCRDADDRYWAQAEAKLVDDARLCLESRGYVVTPKGRIGTLGAQHFETYWAYQMMQDRTGYKEHIYRRLGDMIGMELVASGALPVVEAPGPINLDGIVFSTKLKIIKPEGAA